MQSYIFHQLGAIPGIPGTFGNCRVDVDDTGNVTVTPLSPLPGGDMATSEVQSAQQQEIVQPESPVIVRTAPYTTSTVNGG